MLIAELVNFKNSKLLFPRVYRFPVPLDKGNEDSGDEIEVQVGASYASSAFLKKKNR